MNSSIYGRAVHGLRSTAAILLAGCTTAALAQEVPIVKPGAPGEANQMLSVEQASKLAGATHTPADVDFMQGMIVHHQQAVDMAALVEGRTNNEDIVALAGRIDASQKDEMEFMTTWLADRGEPAAMQMTGHGDHAHHHAMMGMATPEQMAALAASNGTAFDRMFLQLMIRHHAGAVDMVDDLHSQPGAAYEPVMFEFTNDVAGD